MRGVWSGLWLWLLAIVLLTMASCSANRHHHEHREKLDHEWRGVPVQGMPEHVWRPSLFNGDIFQARERSIKMGVVESVNSWVNWAADKVSGAFRGGYEYLEDLAQARHEFYTKFWQQIVPSRSSVRFTRFGNPGATEPLAAIIPRPPTLSHGYGMKAKMSLIMSHVIKKFFLTTVTSSEDASCYDVMNDQLMLFRTMLKDEIQHALCETGYKTGCTQKLCNLLDTNSDMAVDMVFARLKINQGEAVMAHVSDVKCKGAKHWKRHAMQVLKLGSDVRRNMLWQREPWIPPMLKGRNADEVVRKANDMVNELCEESNCPNVRQACSVRKHNEKLFNALFMSKLQPWDLPARPSFKPLDLPTLHLPVMPVLRPLDLPARPYYRRAMIFRGPGNVHIVESGSIAIENIDVHFFDRIKSVFKVNDEGIKDNRLVKEEDTPVIKMATENPGAAAI